MKNKLHLLSTILFMGLILNSSVLGQTATAPSGGDGSSDKPYEIATLNNLYWLSQQEGKSDASGNLYWTRNYLQTSDIDATGCDIWDSNAGFTPIGNSLEYFKGSYDGGGYMISNLTINRPSSSIIGLFGRNRGTIKNLGLTSISILGYSDVGGLIGLNDWYSSVTKCYTNGVVSGYSRVGGFVGTHSRNIISECYSTCDVNASSTAGGFAGECARGISDCYSTGNVSRASGKRNTAFGGFCGFLSSGTINNCYSIGKIQYAGTTNPIDKGFTGFKTSGTSSDDFWDIYTSGQTTDATGTATGKTTIEMKDVATFTNETKIGLTTAWDFETDPNNDTSSNNYWDLDAAGIINSGYPFLSWQNGLEVKLPVERNSFMASPMEYKLAQNHPNPFNPSTQISFTLANAGNVNVSIYNALGQKVAELVNSNMDAGTHNVEFNASNLASGLYFYRLDVADYSKTMKMLLLK